MERRREIITGDACRDVGIVWKNDTLRVVESVEEVKSEVLSFYFKTIAVSDNEGLPYIVFTPNTPLVNVPRVYCKLPNGDVYEILSNLENAIDKLPLVNIDVDFNYTLKEVNFSRKVNSNKIVQGKTMENILKSGRMFIEWENPQYVITTTIQNVILITKKEI